MCTVVGPEALGARRPSRVFGLLATGPCRRRRTLGVVVAARRMETLRPRARGRRPVFPSRRASKNQRDSRSASHEEPTLVPRQGLPKVAFWRARTEGRDEGGRDGAATMPLNALIPEEGLADGATSPQIRDEENKRAKPASLESWSLPAPIGSHTRSSESTARAPRRLRVSLARPMQLRDWRRCLVAKPRGRSETSSPSRFVGNLWSDGRTGSASRAPRGGRYVNVSARGARAPPPERSPSAAAGCSRSAKVGSASRRGRPCRQNGRLPLSA